MKNVEETIVVSDGNLVYAVRLASKLDGGGSRHENSNPYLMVEGGKIKYVDRLYGSKSEFRFSDESHAVAKEIFVSGLRTCIKEQVLRLKQHELVLSEMGLEDCLGNTISESASFLRRIKQKFIGEE